VCARRVAGERTRLRPSAPAIRRGEWCVAIGRRRVHRRVCSGSMRKGCSSRGMVWRRQCACACAEAQPRAQA